MRGARSSKSEQVPQAILVGMLGSLMMLGIVHFKVMIVLAGIIAPVAWAFLATVALPRAPNWGLSLGVAGWALLWLTQLWEYHIVIVILLILMTGPLMFVLGHLGV